MKGRRGCPWIAASAFGLLAMTEKRRGGCSWIAASAFGRLATTEKGRGGRSWIATALARLAMTGFGVGRHREEPRSGDAAIQSRGLFVSKRAGLRRPSNSKPLFIPWIATAPSFKLGVLAMTEEESLAIVAP